MTDGGRCRGFNPRLLFALISGTLLLAAGMVIATPRPAQAIPSFARQTGQPCGACHTDFPALTPFGRRFKLGGYTLGGSPQFRTTPFPTSEEDKAKPWWPPVAMMAIVGFTHTQAPLPPPTTPYGPNNNVNVDPFSFFWGGAITEHIGAFAQVTYAAVPPGGFAAPLAPAGDPFGHTWGWDNADVRYANTTKIGDLDILYGITANNNPTVQDVWNTTPAWTFPYAASTFSAGFGPSTIIDGTFAGHVVSTGGYLLINDMFYVEASAYQTLDFNTLNRLGADHPWLFPIDATTGTFGPTDKFTDIGIDAQYQYKGDNYWVTLRGSYIHEHQRLDASLLLMNAANPTNELNTLRLQASLAYGNDNRIVLTGQYFNTWGTPDATLFSADNGFANNSPNTDGFIAEIAYIPFGTSAAPGWPWFNARIGLQYTWYNKFNGTTAGASANNTLFLHAWLAM